MEGGSGVGVEVTTDDLLRVVGKQAIRIAELESENTEMRGQVGINVAEIPKGYGIPNRTTLRSPEEPSHKPHATYEHLSRKYAELLARHECLQEISANRERKYREAKDVIRQWKAYIDRNSSSAEEVEVADQIQAGEKVPSNDETFRVEASKVQTANGEDRDFPLPEATDKVVYGNLVDEQQVRHDVAQHVDKIRQVTSSQTTEDISEFGDVSSSQIKKEPSDDDVVEFVSAQQLKRKAGENGSTRSPRRIKKEPTSQDTRFGLDAQNIGGRQSPPQQLQRCETSDLDAIGTPLITPRKPESHLRHGQHALLRDRAGLWPPRQRPTSESEQTGLELSMATGATPAVSREPARLEAKTSSDRENRQPRLPSTPSRRALQQISANVPSPRRIRKGPRTSNQRPDVGFTTGKVKSEDCGDTRLHDENVEPPEQNHIKTETPDVPHYNAFLSNRIPDKLTSMVDNIPSGVRQLETKGSRMPQSPRKADRRSPSMHPPIAHWSNADAHEGPATTKAEGTTLRSRRLSHLQLDDFKVNPGYMGTDFAFVDTLRGREQRRLLPVCTRPDCCGETFRRVVDVGGTSVSGMNDAAALADYLGPQWAAMMDDFGPAKRREVLVRAHVDSFARAHGKHRHAFARRRTPPGFWRTDMPTSQEEAHDRVQARQVERQMVEERWLDALRHGGRWVFRDE